MRSLPTLLPHQKTNMLKKNLSRIKKFFSSRDIPVEITPISKGNAIGSHTHKIEYMGGKDSAHDFNHVVQCLFLGCQPLPDNAYQIDADITICRKCGCSDNNACLGGCFWVEEDLCSTCAKAADVNSINISTVKIKTHQQCLK